MFREKKERKCQKKGCGENVKSANIPFSIRGTDKKRKSTGNSRKSTACGISKKKERGLASSV